MDERNSQRVGQVPLKEREFDAVAVGQTEIFRAPEQVEQQIGHPLGDLLGGVGERNGIEREENREADG
jgi:hypothetical protein